MTRKKIIQAIITIVGVILAIYFSKVLSIYLTNKNRNTDIMKGVKSAVDSCFIFC